MRVCTQGSCVINVALTASSFACLRDQLQDEERRRKQQLEEIRKREAEERAKQEEERRWREEERARREAEEKVGLTVCDNNKETNHFAAFCLIHLHIFISFSDNL